MSSTIFASHHTLTKPHSPPSSNSPRFPTFSIFSIPSRFPLCPSPLNSSTWASRKLPILHCSKSSDEAEVSETEDIWLQRLPDKKKPLYSHSLPCIESWLKSLDFYQSKDDRSLWFVQHPSWHAQLNLDITDLCIRYLKSGPGVLEKEVERRFSYALSRQDIENAILGGP